MSAVAQVRCASCHRVERWEEGVVHVELPGGSRRPAAAAPRVAFEALAAHLAGEQGPPVGRCSVCGQPLMLVQGEAPVIDWVVPLPDGEVTFSEGRLTCGDQPIGVDEVERRVKAAYPVWDQWSAQDVAAQGVLMASLPVLVFPAVLWMAAVTVVIAFYSHWAAGGGSVGMP